MLWDQQIKPTHQSPEIPARAPVSNSLGRARRRGWRRRGSPWRRSSTPASSAPPKRWYVCRDPCLPFPPRLPIHPALESLGFRRSPGASGKGLGLLPATCASGVGLLHWVMERGFRRSSDYSFTLLHLQGCFLVSSAGAGNEAGISMKVESLVSSSFPEQQLRN